MRNFGTVSSLFGALLAALIPVCSIAQHPYRGTHPIYKKQVEAGVVHEEPAVRSTPKPPPPRNLVPPHELVEVGDLELELWETNLIVRPDDAALQQKIEYNYEARIKRDCTPGPGALEDRVRGPAGERCADVVARALKLNPGNLIALCSKHGSNSTECKPDEVSKDQGDIYQRLEDFFGATSIAGVTGVVQKEERNPAELPVPPALRPVKEQIYRESINYVQNQSQESKRNLIGLYEKMVLGICPPAANQVETLKKTGSVTLPNAQCAYYARALLGFDPNSTLAACYILGYDSTGCDDYVKLQQVGKELQGVDKKSGGKDSSKGFTKF